MQILVVNFILSVVTHNFIEYLWNRIKLIRYSIFAKFKQIIVIFKRFPTIKHWNNMHNNHISIVINMKTKQKIYNKSLKSNYLPKTLRSLTESLSDTE